ncbi:hypothetical protein C5B42_04650 [Candidatus Cerribacteria bacterium 'Amazon FNV 2010 28 9']|uniref:Uncharacterized protein n=1 Tax=Candidatus Cerribacteria bacterium 'Amazon FNV 2010 28 9' TaxID=2081795 RepID=A0A317JP49_9BACT|nr:MAG: hypothetical protein C5B42_04650 [Candidatus Cerribacteria bacterium 'Amazon FNV 2010 28 9']
MQKMNNGFLFPLIKSNFHFDRLLISDGIFLIDSFIEKVNITSKKNVGILILPAQLKNIPQSGSLPIEIATDITLLYCFIKTKRTYDLGNCYEVSVDEHGKILLKFEKPIDFFANYGWAIWSYQNFLLGSDRMNIFTKDILRVLQKGRIYFNNYYSLYKAQLHPDWKTPLGVAMKTFVAAFGNEGDDDQKFILILTALEALFSNSAFEVTFRLSSNIAWFLHPRLKDYDDRRIEFEKVKQLYNVRSQIVHGRYREVLAEEYDSILDLFSNIIQTILENYKIPYIFLNKEKHTEFLKKLELGYLDLDE